MIRRASQGHLPISRGRLMPGGFDSAHAADEGVILQIDHEKSSHSCEAKGSTAPVCCVEVTCMGHHRHKLQLCAGHEHACMFQSVLRIARLSMYMLPHFARHLTSGHEGRPGLRLLLRSCFEGMSESYSWRMERHIKFLWLSIWSINSVTPSPVA